MQQEQYTSAQLQSSPKHRRAILWDMDGVFCDGEPPFKSAQLRALQDHLQYLLEDFNPSDKDFLKGLELITTGRSSLEIYKEMVQQYFDHNDSEEKKAKWVESLGKSIDRYNLEEIDKLEQAGKYLYEDTVATFLECARRRVPMVIVTGSLGPIAQHTIDLLVARAEGDPETQAFIRQTVIAFTPETYPGFSKPHPEPYNIALAHVRKVHGVEDAIVIEDSPSGVQAAVKAGCVTLVRNDMSDSSIASRIREWVTDETRIHPKIQFDLVAQHLGLDTDCSNSVEYNRDNEESQSAVIVLG